MLGTVLMGYSFIITLKTDYTLSNSLLIIYGSCLLRDREN